MEVNERREETKILIIFSLFLVAFCIISIAFLGVIFTCLFDDDYTKNSMLATWRTMGKIFVMSSDADIEETDTNLIETIWIKNPQTFAISMQVMIGL